jgi:CheY-like chemotaxis protein
MPIMDGRTAAKEIRKLEAKEDHQQSEKSLRVDDRIPIFAVSASLYESDRSSLSADFDGWLLKPLDFGRVRELFKALQDPSKRNQEVYVQGQWERGGYFYGESLYEEEYRDHG